MRHLSPPRTSFLFYYLFTLGCNSYGVIFHAFRMPHTQIMLNTATRVKHVVIKNKYPCYEFDHDRVLTTDWHAVKH